MPRHFLTGEELSAPELYALLDRAIALKAAPLVSRVLQGKTAALLFEHPSTRTRTSMEAGVYELGGHPMVLRANELQLTRGESIRDTALVFSRHAAVIGLRTSSEERLLRIRAFFDHYGAAVQLGVLPRPGTMGEKALLMLRGFGLRNS